MDLDNDDDNKEDSKDLLEVDTLGQLNSLLAAKNIRAEETPAFNLRLIAEVKQRAFLYDHNDDGYNVITWRNSAWAEIATALQATPEQVKTRWKTLRDRFKKEEKKERSSGKAATWVFQKPLRFIQPHVKDRFNDENGDSVEDGKDDNNQVTSTPMETAISFIRHEMGKNDDNSTDDASRGSPDAVAPASKRTRVSLTDMTPRTFTANSSFNRLLGNGGVGSGVEYSSRPSLSSFQRLDDEEDEIFAHLLAIRLSRLDPRSKELAKLRLMQALFDVQFGEQQQ